MTYDAPGTPITGLADSVKYYVRLDAADPTHKFRLAALPTSAVTLTLDPTGTTGLHTLRTEGVDIGTSSDSYALALDLAPGSSLTNVNDLLEGPRRRRPPFDPLAGR